MVSFNQIDNLKYEINKFTACVIHIELVKAH